MVKLLALALLAGAFTTSVSAVEVNFKRYAKHGCDDLNHIPADTDLHNPHCKSFDPDEPAFYSFELDPHDDEDDLKEKLCEATVYTEEDCHGQGATYGNMKFYANKCMDINVPGRSVLISCKDKPDPVVRLPLPTSNTVTLTKHVHSAIPQETTTMVLVPSHQLYPYGYGYDYDCHDCDGW